MGKRISTDEYLAITRRFVQGQGKVGLWVRVKYTDGEIFQSPITVCDDGTHDEPRRSDRNRHSADFHSVVWNGRPYTFTNVQAAIAKKLWQAWEDGTPAMSQETLLEGSESTSTRLRDVFKGHEAWNEMIVSPGKGLFQLADPE